VSFFLIVYYQNQSSIVSGLFTLLMNRIGDRFFLGRLMLMFYMFPDFSFFRSDLVPILLAVLLVLTFMTKRALYPFSPWLPIAMAAPTPISALVHSSTLVTAGLYLIMRFSYILYGCPSVLKLLFIVSLFTSFYAGLNTMFEVDFKKLIALSTLRHLGFIGIAFSLGLLHLRFFHLLVHALFKSLLFMTMGDIMINLNHSQDARYLSSGFIYTPFSCFIMSVSLVNLLGLPRLRGFFSKDLVLETIRFSNVSFFLELVLYLNVIFTYYYTYKLFFYSFRSNKLNPYQMFHSVRLIHVTLICFLGLSTLVFSSFFIRSIFSFVVFYPLALSVKFVPLILNSLMFAYLVVFLALPTLKSKLVASYCSSMLFLSNLAITFSSNLYYKVLFSAVKSTEIGFINYSLNSQIAKPLSVLTSSLFLSLYKVQHTSFYLILFLVPIVFSSFALYAG
jgi:NADH-ubiquinone oxidoreductase chain 5